MEAITKHLFLVLILTIVAVPVHASAGTTTYSTVGAGSYDLVSCHTGEKPLRGNGNHVAVHDGVTYLFINGENREAFSTDPDRYLPMYGGYCAYGFAVGKKFFGEPDMWAVIDDRLYLNLDNKVQGLWSKDVHATSEKPTKTGPGSWIRRSRSCKRHWQDPLPFVQRAPHKPQRAAGVC